MSSGLLFWHWFTLLRFYPFVGIWRFYMILFINLMTCIFWRCMFYIRCDCWIILSMHVGVICWRRSVYFLNIWFIHVFYRFNRNRVLQFPTSRSSLLYIEVWKIRWKITSTKRVVWSLLIFTNGLLSNMVIVLWRINFKCIPCIKEHFCRQSCYPCLVAETRTE